MTTKIMGLLVLALAWTRVVDAGVVVVTSTPRGATVMEGEEKLGVTPCRLNMEAGRHRIVLQHDDCEDLVRIFAAGEQPVILTLEMEYKKYPVIIVWEKDDPEYDDRWYVFVDGAPLRDDTKQALKLPLTTMLKRDTYVVSVCRSGYRDLHKRVTVIGADEGQVVEFPMPKKGASALDSIRIAGDYWRYEHPTEVLKLRPNGTGVIGWTDIMRDLTWEFDQQTLMLTIKWGLETTKVVQGEDGAWTGSWVNRGNLPWGIIRSPIPI
ncbi:MAG TPA: PEGA domain-containing protein, partial [Steroidobacteraceae bacterium]|nr:PEGA domain-containing protein [Steroidobacteraceae bacterium]